jgi:hypothetical protein
VVKNKFSGKKRSVLVPIYTDYGVADIDSCIWFLNDKYSGQHWKTRTRKVRGESVTAIDAKELNLFLKEEDLIKHIEDNSLEEDVKKIVGQVWAGIEDGIMLDRKPRFGG